ncbi:hypothetical protein ACROYT_G008350 [Oculina patagonica]
MTRLFRAFQLATQRSGLFGINIAVSNTIAAISAATGQDLGSVHENSWAVFEFSAENEIKVVGTETGNALNKVASEKSEPGIYASLVLPTLVIGTVGGGTQTPTAKESLSMIGCFGKGGIYRLAEIIASFALAMEISTLSAIASDQFANGISADDKKVASLNNASPPKNATEARSFLGLAKYLERFIKDFASISAPIRQLTHQNAFQVTTDHKPLETIFNNPTCKATARVERLQLRLQPYKTKVVYKPGANNRDDYMSRHPDPKQSQSSNHLSRVDAYIHFVTNNAVPHAVTLQEVKDATAADETLQSLARVIATQKWHEALRADQAGVVSIKWRNSEKDPHNSSREATRSNDYASSQWTLRNCQDQASSARFSLVSRNGRGSCQRVPTMPGCEP